MRAESSRIIENKNKNPVTTKGFISFHAIFLAFKRRATVKPGDLLRPRCLSASDVIAQHFFANLPTPDWLPGCFSRG